MLSRQNLVLGWTSALKKVLVMPYTPLFHYDLLANAFQRWNKIRLNNDGLRDNKAIESFIFTQFQTTAKLDSKIRILYTTGSMHYDSVSEPF